MPPPPIPTPTMSVYITILYLDPLPPFIPGLCCAPPPPLGCATGCTQTPLSYISSATPTEPWSTDENRAMCLTLCSTPSTSLYTLPKPPNTV